MLKLLKKWTGFILETGTGGRISREKKKYIQLCNQLAFTWIWLIIPYLIIMAKDNWALILLSSLIGIHISVIFFNKYKLYLLSRIIESTLPTAVIFLIGCIAYTQPGENTVSFNMLNLAFFIIPFLLFSIKERKYIAISISFSFLLYLSFDYVNPLINVKNINPNYASKSFEVFNYFVSAALLIIGFSYLKHSNVISELRIINLLKRSQSKNEMIRKKNIDITLREEKIIQQKEEIMAINQSLMIKNKQIEKQSHFLQVAYKDIMDSVKYAQRIQQTILPPEDHITEFFPESFVLFKPKDIVSGDFYWLEKKGNKTLFAAADCTGHGVPGAFMSILGQDILHQVTEEIGLTEPADILDKLNIALSKKLKCNNPADQVFDSVNLSLCCYDKEQEMLHFSGAYHPLIHISGNQVEEVLPDRASLGNYHELGEVRFTNKTLRLKKGDVVYLFSDGYVDQIGGNENKKFKKKRLKQLLLDIHEMDMKKQKQYLDSHHEEWKGPNEQTDDILFMGMRF